MNIGILDSKEEEQEAQNNLNALNQKQILDNGQDIFASNKIKDPVIDEPLIQDKRQDVEANIPAPVSVFSMKHSLISEGKYTFLDKDGTFKKAKRTTPSSKYMQPILDKLKDLDTLLEGKFDSKDQNAIHKCFRDTILACENYIANRNPWTAEGKARLAMVKDFQKQIQTESIQFADRVEELVKGDPKLLEGKTWLSILSEVRTEVIENNKDGAEVEIGGAGTSKVYIITKNDSTRYFKENEKVPKRSVFQLLGDRTKTFKKKEDDTSKRRARYLEITNKTLKKLYGDERSVLMALFNDGKEDWELASLLRNWAKLDRNFGEMMDEIDSLDHKYAVAKDYDDIYDNMLKGLLNANIYKSTEILNGVVSQLRYTRVAWKSVMIANGMKHITLDESEQKLLSEVEQAIPEDAKQA